MNKYSFLRALSELSDFAVIFSDTTSEPLWFYSFQVAYKLLR